MAIEACFLYFDCQLDIGLLALMKISRCVVYELSHFRYLLITYLESGAVKNFRAG